MQLKDIEPGASIEGIDNPLARETRTRQRKKTKISVTADEDFEPAEPARKRKGKRRAGKAKLEEFMKLPMDILTEVCLYLHPLDLLHLARTSRRLHDIFMSKGWESAWRAARSTVNGLPDCPADLSEPQYASLMFEIGCQVSYEDSVFPLEARHITDPSCGEMLEQNGPKDGLSATPSALQTLCIPGAYQRACERCTSELCDELPCNDKLSSRPEVLPSVLKNDHRPSSRRSKSFQNFDFDDAVATALTKEYREEADAIIQTGCAMENFKSTEKFDKSRRSEELSAARVSQIEDRLLTLGWTKGDIPRSGEWHVLTYRPSVLSDQVWKRLYPKLEPLLEVKKRTRLIVEKEIRRQDRDSKLRQLYHMYMAELEIEEGDLSRRNPLGIVDIARIPSIAALLEADTNGISPDDWAATNDDLKALILSRAQELETHLESLLVARPTASTKWEKLHLDRLEEAEEEWTTQPLAHINSFFVCDGCNILLWADEVPQHRCFKSFEEYTESLRVPLRAPVTKQLIGRLLDAVKSDFPDAEALLQSEERNLICERCDPRIAEPVTFKNLVRHFDECNWDHIVALCAPLRPVTTANPARTKSKQLNPHDCCMNASLVTRSTPAITEARRPIKDEFAVHCTNLMFSATTHLWTMFGSTERVCLLCPDMGDRIQAMELGPMEIHIRQIHGKEPRLAEDSRSVASARGPRGPSAFFNFLQDSWSDIEDSDEDEGNYFF